MLDKPACRLPTDLSITMCHSCQLALDLTLNEVHHSGSLTETTQHQPGPVVPTHAYSTAAVEASSSENSLEQPSTNSLEQPSTTSGGGSGTSDGSSSCEVVPDL